MTHWLSKIEKILLSERIDLKTLALSVGGDPRIFYVNQDLSKCDLRGQDLTGMNLSGTNINSDQMNELTKIDAPYDPRFRFEREYISLRVPIEIIALVHAYAEESKYVYLAWAYKNLIETGLNYVQINRHSSFEIVSNSEQLRSLLDPRKRPYRRVTIQIYAFLQKRAFEWAKDRNLFLDNTIYLELILSSLVGRKVRASVRKDYSGISAFSLYPKAREYLNILESGGSI